MSAPAARPPNCGRMVPKRTPAPRSVEAVERRGVPAGDQRALVGRDVLEVLRQRLPGTGPGAVAVRIVRRPHDVPEPRAVARGDAGEVADERRVALPVPVRARLLLDDRLGPEAMLLERLIHA